MPPAEAPDSCDAQKTAHLGELVRLNDYILAMEHALQFAEGAMADGKRELKETWAQVHALLERVADAEVRPGL